MLYILSGKKGYNDLLLFVNFEKWKGFACTCQLRAVLGSNCLRLFPKQRNGVKRGCRFGLVRIWLMWIEDFHKIGPHQYASPSKLMLLSHFVYKFINFFWEVGEEVPLVLCDYHSEWLHWRRSEFVPPNFLLHFSFFPPCLSWFVHDLGPGNGVFRVWKPKIYESHGVVSYRAFSRGL